VRETRTGKEKVKEKKIKKKEGGTSSHILSNGERASERKNVLRRNFKDLSAFRRFSGRSMHQHLLLLRAPEQQQQQQQQRERESRSSHLLFSKSGVWEISGDSSTLSLASFFFLLLCLSPGK